MLKILHKYYAMKISAKIDEEAICIEKYNFVKIRGAYGLSTKYVKRSIHPYVNCRIELNLNRIFGRAMLVD